MTTKKIFILLTAIACCAATAFAESKFAGTYKGALSMSGQDLGKSNVDIYSGNDGSHVTFVLPDFNFLGSLPVGDIVLIDVPVSGGALSLSGYQLYLPALKPLGQALVKISTLEGSAFAGDSLTANLSIEIAGLGAVPATFKGERLSGGFQVPNSGFEEWEEVTSKVKKNLKGPEPLHWNSFVSASVDPDPAMSGLGSLLQMALNNEQLRDSLIARPGSTGVKSALVTSKYTFGVAANGNLTTGRINAGSMDAKSPYNTNKSIPSNPDEFKCPFYGSPDSVAVWVKYRPADGNIDSAVNMAGLRAVIHKDCYYQDPEDSILRVDSTFTGNDTILDSTYIAKYDTVKVAQAVASYKAAEGYAWQRLSVPFEYPGAERATKDSARWIIVSFSTNLTPGGGTTSGSILGGKNTKLDSIFVDDLSLIYNPAQLTSLKVGNETIALAEGTYSYRTKQKFNDTTLAVTAETAASEGVKAITAFNRAKRQMTVIVRGGDYAVNRSNVQIYTVEFTGDDTSVDGVYDNGEEAIIYTEGTTLRIETSYTGEIAVYSIDGRPVTTTLARTVILPDTGVYLVRIEGRTYKVIAR